MGEHYVTIATVIDRYERGLSLEPYEVRFLLRQIDILQQKVKALQCDTCKTPMECGWTVAPLCRLKEVSNA